MGYSDGKEALFRYNKRGELVELTDWNGTATVEHDLLGREVKVTDHEGSITESYGYDALGNRILKQLDGIEKATYQYNALNQLVKRVEDGVQYSYGYDKRGNLIQEHWVRSQDPPVHL